MLNSSFLNCIFGPRLYRVHGSAELTGRDYQAKAIESLSDRIIRIVAFTCSVGFYSSPILLFFLHRRGIITLSPNVSVSNEYVSTVVRLGGLISIAAFVAFLSRGVSRMRNNDYVDFVSVLNRIKKMSPEEQKNSKSLLHQYDFDFAYWPVDFKWNESKFANAAKPPAPLQRRTRRSDDTLMNKLIALPCNVMTFLVAQTIGRRMIYPGSVSLLQTLVHPGLVDGRKRLVERHNGRRYKLLAQNGDEIDTMFVDRRSRSSMGQTLVICCEGNAGFYETGITVTPLHTDYSVLGWNHPGFGGSTGLPFPENEVSAVDVVVKFAIDKLGFSEKSIIIMGWSIGGYTASWAAMTYPDIKGLILDACFDDISPLALAKMPSLWTPLVIPLVKNYFNLNVSAHLDRYSGPVLIIRRTQDEIINTSEDEPTKTNRANDILFKLFKARFPILMEDEKVCETLEQWLSGGLENQRLISRNKNVDPASCMSVLKSFIKEDEENRSQYPLMVGENLEVSQKIQLSLFLASKHFVDFNEQHCAPLPTQIFSEPWNLFNAVKNSSSL
ncbi:protein ABHD16A [Tetranychus urticae]|uniref:Uncharacterized protein n=1 Tax=Tetranychus urticae TaxID=32264 RepID=T1JVE6_TETUR|nr:protein ABHD16A [Tetranychus urticae]